MVERCCELGRSATVAEETNSVEVVETELQLAFASHDAGSLC